MLWATLYNMCCWPCGNNIMMALTDYSVLPYMSMYLCLSVCPCVCICVRVCFCVFACMFIQSRLSREIKLQCIYCVNIALCTLTVLIMMYCSDHVQWMVMSESIVVHQPCHHLYHTCSDFQMTIFTKIFENIIQNDWVGNNS